jgi:hypothetical protein
MKYSKDEQARVFWNRFDEVRGKRHVKSICELAGLEYEPIRVLRTRHRLPDLCVANKLSKIIDVSMEYLLTGKNEDNTTTICEEAKAVQDSPVLKRIVRLCLDRPDFLLMLQSFMGVNEKMEKSIG